MKKPTEQERTFFAFDQGLQPSLPAVYEPQ